MNILGVKLHKPSAHDYGRGILFAVIGLALGWLTLVPFIGGGSKNVIAVAISMMLAGFVSSCGASFDKAGWRGLLLTVLVCALGYGLWTSLF